jgi:hypothetical protein
VTGETGGRVLISGRVVGPARPPAADSTALELPVDVEAEGVWSTWWVLLETKELAAEAADLAAGETAAFVGYATWPGFPDDPQGRLLKADGLSSRRHIGR